MDFIDGLDVELEKEFYYPGETIKGFVLLSCIANVKIRGEWKIKNIPTSAKLYFSIFFY